MRFAKIIVHKLAPVPDVSCIFERVGIQPAMRGTLPPSSDLLVDHYIEVIIEGRSDLQEVFVQALLDLESLNDPWDINKKAD